MTDIEFRWYSLATDAEIDLLSELAADAAASVVFEVPTGDAWA